MSRLLKGIAILGLLAALLAFAALAGVLLQQPVLAQDETPTATTPVAGETERLITVTGQGSVMAQPDTATVRIGVQTEANTAAEALAENNVRMNGVISATLDAGVEEADIQTAGLRLNPRYDSSDGGPPQLTGYEAANTVMITVQNLDNLGELLDTAVEAGGNTIEGIQFEVSDNDALRAAAREAAMEEATAKAEQLTGLAGAELGEVVTIQELGGSQPRPVTLQAEAPRAAAGAVPVQAGQQTIEASVQVTWRIR